MEKSSLPSISSPVTQTTEPPPTVTTSPAVQDLPSPTTGNPGHSPSVAVAEAPPLAMDVDRAPAVTPGATSQSSPTAANPGDSPSVAVAAAEAPSLAMDVDKAPTVTPEATGQPSPPVSDAAKQPPPPLLETQVPAPPSSTATIDPPARGRKRALEVNSQIENSKYYKMRLVVKDLRPHVLEVLRTPDFRNCKAAMEIQEKMKLMLELYQEMAGEKVKREKTTKSETLTNGKTINQTPQSTAATIATATATTAEPRSSKEVSDGNGSKVGDTVVGGSAFGWNFVTYGGTEAVYCGMSKEEYRSSHPIIEVEAEIELQKT